MTAAKTLVVAARLGRAPVDWLQVLAGELQATARAAWAIGHWGYNSVKEVGWGLEEGFEAP